MLLRRAAFPDFCEPCLPSPAEKPPAGAGWLHEIKHDGFRMLVRRDGAGVRLFTRNGHDWTGRFPLIARAACDEARGRGRLGKGALALSVAPEDGRNRIMIYDPEAGRHLCGRVPNHLPERRWRLACQLPKLA